MNYLTVPFLLMLLLPIDAAAQELLYHVKRDNPAGAKNLVIHIDPWFTDVQVSGPATGAAIRADWLASRIMDVSLEWRTPYFDLNAYELKQIDLTREHLKPVAGLLDYQYVETCLRWHLSDKIKQKNHTILVSKSTYASEKSEDATKYIELEAKSRRIASFETGAYYMNSTVLFRGSMLFPRLSENSGYVFNSIPSQSDMSSTSPGGSRMQTIGLIGGFSFQKINNLKILTNQYGVKYSTGWSNIYFQGIFAPVQRFGNVLDSAGLEWEVSNKNLLPWGFRLGYSYKNTKSTNWALKMNIGTRPGLGIISGAFMDLNFGVSVPAHARLKGRKNSAEVKSTNPL